MKQLIACAAIFAALISPAFAAVATGQMAPDYQFTDISGAQHKISEFKGKIVVLEWTNPGCPFVHKFYDSGSMPKFQQQALADKNVVWFAVNSSAEGKEGYLASDKDAADWVAKNKFAGTGYVRDPSGAFGHLYGAKTSPHMFVIGKDGKLAYQGAIDSKPSPDPAEIAQADNYALDAIAALQNGEQPKETSTQPYGCGVKYGD